MASEIVFQGWFIRERRNFLSFRSRARLPSALAALSPLPGEPHVSNDSSNVSSATSRLADDLWLDRDALPSRSVRRHRQAGDPQMDGRSERLVPVAERPQTEGHRVPGQARRI